MGKCRNLGKEMAMMLTDDLISEILVRLPVISILRCRCVCKAWFHLIKTPNFIDMHLKHSTSKKVTILLAHYPNKLIPPILTFHAYESLDLNTDLEMEIPRFDYQCLQISGPCNGLLCLLDYQSKLVLYNPSMGEYRPLPRCPFPSQRGWKHLVTGFGFGFVSNPDDYKVVTFVSFFEVEVPLYEDHHRMEIKIAEEGSSSSNSEDNDVEDNSDEDDDGIESDQDNIEIDYDDDECGCGCTDYEPLNKVQVYTRSTNSWREIDCECPDSLGDNRYATQFNGASHWIAQSRKGIDIIVYFHMRTELLHEMELPEDLLDEPGIRKSLTVLNDSLALFAYTSCDYNSEEQFIDIWVMIEYGVAESWTKHITIGPLSGIRCPLMVWKDEAILLEDTDRQLLSCALDTCEIDEFKLQGNRGLISAMVFQESLISLL